jgi:hypothetical protein
LAYLAPCCYRYPVTFSLPAKCASRFAIQQEIGRGGFGTVFLATQTHLDRPVALKVLLPELVSTPESMARFENEAHIMSRLRHPSIVSVLDHDVEDGIPWIAFEYVPGKSLRTRLEKGPLPWREVVAIGIAMASALEVAHEKGVLHRDIKPENIIAKDEASWKLTDFGIARWADATNVRTEEGVLLGTPQYFSPQQLMGVPVDPRTDLYSLGITLYELTTGQIPFWEETLVVSLQKRLNDPLPPASSLVKDVPVGLDEILRRLLSPDRDRRFETASALKKALTEVNAGDTTPDATVQITIQDPERSGSRGRRTVRSARPARQTLRSEPLPQAVRPMRWLLTASALAGLLLAIGGVQRFAAAPPVRSSSVPAAPVSVRPVGPNYTAIEYGLGKLVDRVKSRTTELIEAGVERGFGDASEHELRRLVAEIRKDRATGLELWRKLASSGAEDALSGRHRALQAVAAGFQFQTITGMLQLVGSVRQSTAIGYSQFNVKLSSEETPSSAIGSLQEAADTALRALGAPWSSREQPTMELLFESMSAVSLRAHDTDWAETAEMHRKRTVRKIEANLDAALRSSPSPWARLGACAWHSGYNRTNAKALAEIRADAHQILEEFSGHAEATGWNLRGFRVWFEKK